MNGTFEELSDEEKALVAVRARGDYIMNCALEWIARFHTQFPAPLISQLLEGIRTLSRAMHERSAKKIEGRIADLLEIQSSMLLLGSQQARYWAAAR